MKASAIAVELVAAPTDEVHLLIGELEAILAAEYPPEQRHGLPVAAIFQAHIRFFMARVDGTAAGCGGVAQFADFAEVKRMYVREAARGSGAAPALLRAIETAAREAGLTLLRLETGVAQSAALRFYEREGFKIRGPFGDYLTLPPHTIATSVFMEKAL
jgi:putative acetyltransferase